MGIFSKFVSLFQNKDHEQNIDSIEDLLLETGLSPSLVFSLTDSLGSLWNARKSNEQILNMVKEKVGEYLSEYHFQKEDGVEKEVVMLVGVNGVGKTTTVAKLAHFCMKNHGLSQRDILLSAADTFRAAAIEQLEIHSKNLGLDMVKQKHGSDPAAVIFDSLEHASARGRKLVFVDTAGRMNTRGDLMKQLEKSHRIVLRHCSPAQIKIFMVIDGNSGLNTVNQVEDFLEVLPLDAVIVTKYDGGSKGGIIPSITEKTKIPCAFLGTGEQYADLTCFSSEVFLDNFITL